MRDAADEVFHVFVMAVILAFGLFGFLATSGVFDKWRKRQTAPRQVSKVRRRGFRLGKFPAAFPKAPMQYRLPTA